MKLLQFLICPIFFLFFSCDKGENELESTLISSGEQIVVVVNEEQFENAPSDHITILETDIEGDFLRIKFGASGCSGETWKVKLIGSQAINYSLPPQRQIRLSLENKELCEAYFTKEVTFNISAFQTGGDVILLNFINSDTQIRYNY